MLKDEKKINFKKLPKKKKKIAIKRIKIKSDRKKTWKMMKSKKNINLRNYLKLDKYKLKE